MANPLHSSPLYLFMLKNLSFFFLTVFLVACAYDGSNEKQKIKNIMIQQEEAWNRGDIETYMKGYWNNDSLLFFGGSGLTYGFQRVLDNYKRAYPSKKKMGILNFRIHHLDLLNEQNAHVVGEWKLSRTEDTLSGYFSLLWAKKSGEWKIIRDHSS